MLSSDEQSIPTITYQLSKAKSLESYFKGKGMAYTRATQSETIFSLPLGTVNLSSGLGIINEEAGKVTYSFPLHSFEKENGVLYSFILKENGDGTVSSSYILEYKMSDVFFAGYSSGQLSLSQFEGTIRRLGLNSSRTARGAGEDQLCPYQTVGAGDDSSNSGTGDGNIPNDHGDPIGGDGDSGTGDSNGGGPGGGTPPALDCVTTTMVINCGCSGQGCAPGFHPVASCGMNGKYDKNASFLTVVKCLDPDKSMQSSKNNILEPCDGEEDVILIDDEDPITDPIDIENCMKIAEQIADIDFQEKIDVLISNFGSQQEIGFSQNID